MLSISMQTKRSNAQLEPTIGDKQIDRQVSMYVEKPKEKQTNACFSNFVCMNSMYICISWMGTEVLTHPPDRTEAEDAVVFRGTIGQVAATRLVERRHICEESAKDRQR
jgi:hypothetical protein